MMRVIFMGTPEFSVPVLKALHAADHEICAVYTQPPRPAGRGKKDRPSPIQLAAEALDLSVRHPVNLKTQGAKTEFAAFGAEVAVVVAYGLILPPEILHAPTQGCLNVHASLLPRWRGAAPIHRAIMAGDAETGICIMQMEEGLDTGPVLLSQKTLIGCEETTGALHDRLADMGAELLINVLAQYDDLVAKTQPNEGVTYAMKIDKAESHIDWTRKSEVIDRQIRGLSPFPGAWTEFEGTRIKFLGSRCADGDGQPGEVLDDGLRIACGSGAIQITQAQRAGRGVQSTEDFLRGVKIKAGDKL